MLRKSNTVMYASASGTHKALHEFELFLASYMTVFENDFPAHKAPLRTGYLALITILDEGLGT